MLSYFSSRGDGEASAPLVNTESTLLARARERISTCLTTGSPRVTLLTQYYPGKLESDAERQIEEVTSLLEDMSCVLRCAIHLPRSRTEHRLDRHVKHEVDEMAGKVLRGASKVFEFAKGLADIHPAAKVSCLFPGRINGRTTVLIGLKGRSHCDQCG